MISDEFGTLLLPTECPDIPDGPLFWSGYPVNAVSMVVSALLILIAMPGLFRLMPAILNCFTRPRGILEMEHNLQSARSRNRTAWVMAVPFIAIADRYELYSPDWMSLVPGNWTLAVTAAITLGFAFLRLISEVIAMPRSFRGDERMAVRRTIYTFFIFLIVLMSATAGLMAIFHAPDSLSRAVLTAEIASVYLISAIRTGQILGSGCSVFTTFLYLCALEIVPAGILVTSALVF